MARLFDRILRETELKQADADMLATEAKIFEVNNVARYYFAGTDQEEWSILKDFPLIAPPYPLFWMEYQMPEVIVSEVTGVRAFDRTKLAGVGALWQATPLGETESWPGSKETGGWIVQVTTWLDRGKHTPLFCAGGFRFPVTRDGRWGSMDGETIIYEVWPSREAMHGIASKFGINLGPNLRGIPDELKGAVRLYGESLLGHLHPVLLALSFMHCKNVTVIEQRPPDWQQKAAIKKHGHPLITYHTLNIEPMKTVLRTEGDIEHNGLKKALHICRGHFKTYTPDKPLFGRVTGTYWWQSHVRGSVDEGVALKDYNVITPRRFGKQP